MQVTNSISKYLTEPSSFCYLFKTATSWEKASIFGLDADRKHGIYLKQSCEKIKEFAVDFFIQKLEMHHLHAQDWKRNDIAILHSIVDRCLSSCGLKEPTSIRNLNIESIKKLAYELQHEAKEIEGMIIRSDSQIVSEEIKGSPEAVLKSLDRLLKEKNEIIERSNAFEFDLLQVMSLDILSCEIVYCFEEIVALKSDSKCLLLPIDSTKDPVEYPFDKVAVFEVSGHRGYVLNPKNDTDPSIVVFRGTQRYPHKSGFLETISSDLSPAFPGSDVLLTSFFLDQVCLQIKDLVGDSKTVLFGGHSLGGTFATSVAIEYSLRHPDIVKSVLTFNAPATQEILLPKWNELENKPQVHQFQIVDDFITNLGSCLIGQVWRVDFPHNASDVLSWIKIRHSSCCFEKSSVILEKNLTHKETQYHHLFHLIQKVMTLAGMYFLVRILLNLQKLMASLKSLIAKCSEIKKSFLKKQQPTKATAF